MDGYSKLALWTLVAAAVSASGCADLLGFEKFTDNDGGTTGSNSTNTAYGSSSSSSHGGAGTSSTSSGSSSAGSVSGGGATSSSGSSTTASSSSAPSTGTGGSSTASSASSSGGGTSSSSGGTSSSSSMTAQTPGPCTFGTPYNGGGSFTWYYFGQGTYMQNGGYKTACGYSGTESGMTDTVPNAANVSPATDTYFAAIPGTSSSNFDTVTSCGACVEITNGSKKIVATVIDECPKDTNPLCTPGHLDLSKSAFDQLGYSTGNPSGTTWKFVPCPEGTKNIQAVPNSGSQFYLQSSVYPITTVNGQGPTNYGYFNVSPGPAQVYSQAAGQTITINIPGGGGDTGANFTAGTNCY